jgi:hypothetical protein
MASYGSPAAAAPASSAAGSAPIPGDVRKPLDLEALVKRVRAAGYIVPDPPAFAEGGRITLSAQYHALAIWLFEQGRDLEDFALTIGVTKRTVKNWIQTGRREPFRDGGVFGHFYQNYQKAKATYRVQLHQKVVKYGDKAEDWRPFMRLMESEQPAKYGKHKAEVAELKAKILSLTQENERLKSAPPEITPALLASLVQRIPNKPDQMNLLAIVATAMVHPAPDDLLPKKSDVDGHTGGAIG